MSERPRDERMRELINDDVSVMTMQWTEARSMARELVALRDTQEHMRARCVWLQERRKALQRLAATRMVRLRTLRRLKAKLASGPVMPEAPSDAQWSAIVTTIDQHIKPNGRISDVYAAIRAALMQGQS